MVDYTVIPAQQQETDNITLGSTAAKKLEIRAAYEKAKLDNNARVAMATMEAVAAQSIPAQVFPSVESECYTDADGYRNTVNTSTSNSTFSTNKYVRADIANTNAGATSDSGFSSFTLKKTLTLHNGLVAQHTNRVWHTGGGTWAQCRVQFNYSDATNAQVDSNQETAGTAQAKTYVNPNPTKPVSSIGVYLLCNGGGGSANEDQDSATETFATTTIVHALPVRTATPKRFYLIVHDIDREAGDSITYDITDGATTQSGLAVDTVIDATIGSPTGVTIKLNGKASSPTNGKPSIRGYTLMILP